MIYRVHIRSLEEESQGYLYFGSKAAAERAAHANALSGFRASIEHQPTPTTKQQMIALLSAWARHPNNG